MPKKANNPQNLNKRPPGRPKGSKNKIPGTVKERVMAIWDMLEKEGKSLHETAKGDPKWFYTEFIKPLVPKESHVEANLMASESLIELVRKVIGKT